MAQERIIDRDRRFVSKKEYSRITGISVPTITHLVKSGQLKYVTTEGGLPLIDTENQGTITEEMTKDINELKAMVAAICKQFNIREV